MADFTIYPAIDLRGGKVVRLAQGDPNRQTIYSDDPAAMARRWKGEGASWLHVINLDGAFGDATTDNEIALKAILRCGLKVQFGGGLRSLESLDRAFLAGVARAVLGTAAVEDPAMVDAALLAFGPERIVTAIDAREGKVRIRGWAQASALDAIEFGMRMRAEGVRWCVFTDVARDGVSTGVNIPATLELGRATGLRVIASGGVASLEDVKNVASAGFPGLIIGRALYEGTFTLKEALESIKSEQS